MEKQNKENELSIVQSKNEVVEITTKDPEEIMTNLVAMKDVGNAYKIALVAGVDYGTFEKITKPSLFSAGADKIVRLHNLNASYTIIREKEDTKESEYINRFGGVIKYFKYSILLKCEIKKNGLVISESFGECSNTEQGKQGQPINTIIKMGQKRAKVGAVLGLGTLSNVFTQDIETQQEADNLTGGASNQAYSGNAQKRTYSQNNNNNSKVSTPLHNNDPLKDKKLQLYNSFYKRIGFTRKDATPQQMDAMKQQVKEFLAALNFPYTTFLDPKIDEQDIETLNKLIQEPIEKKEAIETFPWEITPEDGDIN